MGDPAVVHPRNRCGDRLVNQLRGFNVEPRPAENGKESRTLMSVPHRGAAGTCARIFPLRFRPVDASQCFAHDAGRYVIGLPDELPVRQKYPRERLIEGNRSLH